MSAHTNLNEVEKKARSTLRQDGLATITAGFAFAIMAPFFLDDRLGFLLILGTGLYVFLPEVLRRRFVYPRLGYVKFKKKKSKIWKLILSILLLIVFVIVLKFSAYGWLLPFYLGMMFGVTALTIGYVHRTVVEYFIASMILLSGIIGLLATMQGNDPGTIAALQLWILAVVLVPIGLVQFILFIRRYPITKESVDETTV